MKLRTEIETSPFDNSIEYGESIFTIGSCFAQSIGGEMVRAKFRSTINPTGTLFNPISIAQTIERIGACRHIEADELREGEQGWYHDDFHSSLNASTAIETLHRINGAIDAAHEALKRSDWVIITLGTAWIYERAESGKVVANCHKEPSRNFLRRRASIEEIVGSLERVMESYLEGKKIILTLSPIRHMSDGHEENSLSKAILRVAIEELVSCGSSARYYFPSYEIMMDDLRDYRFYDKDMVHPSAVAVEYIWERFIDVALSRSTKEMLEKVMRIVRARDHRPINPTSEAYKTLCRAQIKAIESLDGVELGREIDYFKEHLGED